MIVGARLKAEHRQALTIGWNAEVFARTKRMKPLGDYFKPESPVEDKRAQGNAAFVARMRQLMKKGVRDGAR